MYSFVGAYLLFFHCSVLQSGSTMPDIAACGLEVARIQRERAESLRNLNWFSKLFSSVNVMELLGSKDLNSGTILKNKSKQRK